MEVWGMEALLGMEVQGMELVKSQQLSAVLVPVPEVKVGGTCSDDKLYIVQWNLSNPDTLGTE